MRNVLDVAETPLSWEPQPLRLVKLERRELLFVNAKNAR